MQKDYYLALRRQCEPKHKGNALVPIALSLETLSPRAASRRVWFEVRATPFRPLENFFSAARCSSVRRMIISRVFGSMPRAWNIAFTSPIIALNISSVPANIFMAFSALSGS
ncbi:MAG: hypothetical protein ACLPKB_35445 [Xanthobacteraceae bacterium]